MLIRVVLATAAFIALSSADSKIGCSFPGPAHECAAPGAKALIEWREPAGIEQHQLWLRRGATPAAKLLDFGRHVDVLWSPDARVVAITDYRGSDESVLWIATLNRADRLANVEDALIRALGRPTEIYKNGHRYFSAKFWSSATTLVFEVSAYDAAPDREYRGSFIYDLNGHVRQRR